MKNFNYLIECILLRRYIACHTFMLMVIRTDKAHIHSHARNYRTKLTNLSIAWWWPKYDEKEMMKSSRIIILNQIVITHETLEQTQIDSKILKKINEELRWNKNGYTHHDWCVINSLINHLQPVHISFYFDDTNNILNDRKWNVYEQISHKIRSNRSVRLYVPDCNRHTHTPLHTLYTLIQAPIRLLTTTSSTFSDSKKQKKKNCINKYIHNLTRLFCIALINLLIKSNYVQKKN